MPCVVGCLALAFPRLAFVLVWLFGGGYLERAVSPWYWLLLGFLFMPLTTLAFAYGVSSLGPPGEMSPLGWVLTALAALLDLGIVGGGGTHASRRER